MEPINFRRAGVEQIFVAKKIPLGVFCVSGNLFRARIFSCGTRTLQYFGKFPFCENVYLFEMLINNDNITGDMETIESGYFLGAGKKRSGMLLLDL